MPIAELTMPPEAYNNLMTLIPHKRIGEVVDIGHVAAGLTSD